MRVNIDHVEPGQRRSLRDRIGLVKNVDPQGRRPVRRLPLQPQARPGRADRLGRGKRPAESRLLARHPRATREAWAAGSSSSRSTRCSPWTWWPTRPRPPDFLRYQHELSSRRKATRKPRSPWKCIGKTSTLDELRQNRPDLVTALQESADRTSADKGDELKTLQEELKTLKAEKAARELAGGDRRRTDRPRASTRPTRPSAARSSWRTCLPRPMRPGERPRSTTASRSWRRPGRLRGPQHGQSLAGVAGRRADSSGDGAAGRTYATICKVTREIPNLKHQIPNKLQERKDPNSKAVLNISH